MSGKLLIALFYFLSVGNTLFFAQQTFSKTYSGISSSPEGYLLKYNDDEFVIGGTQRTNSFPRSIDLFLIKTDGYGNKKQYAQFALPQILRYPYKAFASAADGGLVYFTLSSDNEKEHLSMSKLNSDFDIQWAKTFEFNSLGLFYIPLQIFSLNNGELLLALAVKENDYIVTDPNRILFIRFTVGGEFIAENNIELNGDYVFNYRLAITSDEKIIVNGDRNICFLDCSLNTLWTKSFEQEINAINFGYGNSIFIAFQNVQKSSNVIFFDQTGNELWQREVPGSITSFTNFASHGFAYITADSNYIRINDDGGVEFQDQLWGNGKNIFEIPGEGYLITGEYEKKFWIQKTDYNGIFKTIILSSIFRNISPYSIIKIDWLPKNIESIDLAFSVDDGITWKNIIQNYPADSTTYPWKIKYLAADSIIIKISDSMNPLYFDVLDSYKLIFSSLDYDFININEILMWTGNNGITANDPRRGGGGFYWPNGHLALDSTNYYLSSVFTDGILMGGLVDGAIRIGGTNYWTDMYPGIIDENGVPADTSDKKYKVWKIRKDWRNYPEGIEKERLEYDYFNWPGDIGAPYEDINNNYNFDPGIDKPEFLGDEVLFAVYNNMDSRLSFDKFGSLPLGVEIQSIIYGFNEDNFLKDVIFKKIRVINKSKNLIENMVISQWSDFDLGFALDDVVGCDTTLGLGFGYNGDEVDDGHYEIPPVIGYLNLQGPIIKAEQNDSAYFNYKWRKGYKNLKMDSFAPIVKNYTPFIFDPRIGDMPFEYYNNLRGLATLHGDTLVDPISGLKTRTPLAGDPVTKTGWYDGDGWPNGPRPYDRRLMLNSGQFNFAPGDTQEVVYAIMMAQDYDRLSSLAKLKHLAKQVKDFYYTGTVSNMNLVETILPEYFYLSQNFPNPFNPTTKIRYELPIQSHVILSVYDILGRKVSELVNKEQNAGYYEAEIDGSNWASGVYFYRIDTGLFTKTLKLVFLK